MSDKTSCWCGLTLRMVGNPWVFTGCPEHGCWTDSTRNFDMLKELQSRAEAAEAKVAALRGETRSDCDCERLREERNKLKERIGPIMAYLAAMLAAYDTDPTDPLGDEYIMSDFCASGMTGVLTVGMLRKALERKT